MSKGTRDLGHNPVCPQGHMLCSFEIVRYSLEVYLRYKQLSNCNSQSVFPDECWRGDRLLQDDN